MTRRRRGEAESPLNRGKRTLIEEPILLEDVNDKFSSYSQYLRVLTKLYLDLIDDAKLALKEADHYRFQQLRKKYREKIERFEEIVEKTEEDKGKFPITTFIEEENLKVEEETILKLLLSKNGIGVQSSNPKLKGKVIIAILKALHDTQAEEARKFLLLSSTLRSESIIGPLDPNLSSKVMPNLGFGISEYGLSEILGEEDRAERIRELYESQLQSRAPPTGEEDRDESGLLEELGSNVELEDVIFPEDENIKSSVLRTVESVLHKEEFYEDWGMKEILGRKDGVTMLFTGPSGCGKTMLAKALGNYLDWNTCYLALDKVVNGLYGHTEKNTRKIFDELEEEQVLVIDEAEGLLNRRYSANNSVDSTETRVLDIFLRELEEHKGVIIFTTNLAVELDRALERRMDLKLEFPKPDNATRKRIWKSHIPKNLPVHEDVDFDKLSRHELTGGQIKNAVVNGARRAMREKREKATQEDFLEGIQSEKTEAMDYSLEDERKNASKAYN